MDTTKLIDAIAQADKADFDETLSQAHTDAARLSEDFLTLATVDAILKHGSRSSHPGLAQSILIRVEQMITQAKVELYDRYPEVKDLL